MKKSKIPKFKNYKEEAKFWDTHDVTEFLDELKPVKAIYEPKVKKEETMTLRFTPDVKKMVTSIARCYDISPSALVRMWVVEKVRSVKVPC